MTLKPLIAAAALAAGLAANASATTVTLTNTVGNLWTGSFSDTPAVGSFTDVFTFVPAATTGSNVQLAFGNLSTTGTSADPAAIIFSSAMLNSTALTPYSGPGLGGFVQGAYLPPTIWSSSGPLTLTVSGTSYGGSYAGTINVTLKPVPEPATYGMLLGGLGLLAAVLRKKSG